MSTILEQEFFNRPTLQVAQSLLGKFLVCTINGRSVSLMLNEVEAYDGPEDKACHAYKGKTARTSVMFGPPGHFYVYLIYGVYWMLNVVVGPEDYPAGVLIRGAGHLDGPGKVTTHLGITKQLYGKKAAPENGLWFEDRSLVIQPEDILQTPRIGIAYAGALWADKPYRFILKKSFNFKN